MTENDILACVTLARLDAADDGQFKRNLRRLAKHSARVAELAACWAQRLA